MHCRDYSDWEQEANKLREEKEVLLDGFKAWLAESGLKEKTIDKHAGSYKYEAGDILSVIAISGLASVGLSVGNDPLPATAGLAEFKQQAPGKKPWQLSFFCNKKLAKRRGRCLKPTKTVEYYQGNADPPCRRGVLNRRFLTV
ncbi:hypothetical protein Thiowin_03873 [Thiorhodovibrio winogradskyi]|uniref:Uncharacterized protein n=1 Tax=Thiorhodovibrio winogradskyi TaxID=77007 RepID=A0ABZ0SCZ6_9GAMM|nr:hypothetical protein [Thiorhodovibrio winogradskyi]